MGYQIAKKLRTTLDIILVRKISIPLDPEGFGAMTVDGDLSLNERPVKGLGLEKAEIQRLAQEVVKEIRRNLKAYGRKGFPDVGGKSLLWWTTALPPAYHDCCA